MATNVLGLKTFAASDPVDYNEINDNYNKIDSGVKTALQGRAAHNWLDNSDMTNAINQRGASSYTGQVYGIDRWYGRAAAQTVSVRSADVTVTATGTSYAGIKQKVHGMPRLAGKTVTFAARLYANVVPELVLFDSSEQSLAVKMGTAGATQTIILTYDVPSDATADSVVPTILLRTSASGDYMRIVWAALYEGAYTADTLPAYQPKGYAAELAECQRHFWRCNNTWFAEGSGYAFSNTEYRVSIILPQMMRVTPTMISSTGNTTSYGIKIHTGAGANLTPTAVSLSMKNNRIALTLTGTFTNGELGVIRLENYYLDFSADL